jgi:hypothetical protein
MRPKTGDRDDATLWIDRSPRETARLAAFRPGRRRGGHSNLQAEFEMVMRQAGTPSIEKITADYLAKAG